MVGWTTGTVAEARAEGRYGRVLLLDVPGWGGNLAGQHLDLRVTAPDGYQAARSYSVASVGPGDRVELAVDRLPNGEVSPYLVDEVTVGDEVEIRGPLGGWFVWRPEQEGPVQLIAGGLGVVPLVAMVRARLRSGNTSPFRLLYSVRTPEDVFFRSELERAGDGVEVTFAYTRRAPEGWPRSPGRVGRAELEERCFRPGDGPAMYVCGPTGFVESVASTLVELGHDARRIKTERFGGT